MTTLRSLLRNVSFSVLANFVNRSANTLLFILISRSLGPTEAGTYSLAISYFFIGFRIASWGLNHLLTREVARRREDADRYFVNFVILRAGLAVTTIAVTFVLVHLLPYSQLTRRVIVIVTLAILPESISDICQALFIAFERMAYLGTTSLIGAATKLALGIYLLWQGKGVDSMAVVYTGTAGLMMVANLAIALTQFTRPVWRLDWHFCRQEMGAAVSFILISTFFILDNQLGVILLSLLGNEEMVGFYAAAMTIISALSLLPEGYRTAVYPVMARRQAQSKAVLMRLYTHSFKYLLLLALPVTVGLMLTANDVIILVYRPGFAPAGPVLSALGWSLGFFFLNILNSSLLIVSNRQDLVARSLLVNTAVTILLNVLVIPLFGVVGSAIIKAATAALLLAQYALAARRYVEAFSPWPHLWRPIIASALMGVSTLLTRPFDLFVQVGLGTAVYLAALVIMGTFPAEEATMWLQLLSKRNASSSSEQ